VLDERKQNDFKQGFIIHENQGSDMSFIKNLLQIGEAGWEVFLDNFCPLNNDEEGGKILVL
jgi:hypothetical protein